MARRNSFQRPRQPRVIGRKIIIVCEGKKTEYGYLQEIRKSMRLPTLQIIVLHPDATDPRSIVRAAIDERWKRKADKSWTADDEAWAVFDGDEHILETRQLERRPANRRSQQGRLAISNPSFEFWYLLHYQEQGGNLSRQEALRLLRAHIKDYEKSNKLWPVPLQPLTTEAIRRAKHLAKRAEADELQPHTNPCTGVCELVESLLTLAEEIRR